MKRPASASVRPRGPRASSPSADERLCQEARRAIERGDRQQARVAYRAAVEAGTRIGDAYNNLAVLCGESGDIDEAIALLDRGLALHPTRGDLRGNLAAFLRARAVRRVEGTGWGAALEDFTRAAAVAPQSMEAHHDLGLCQHRLGRWNEALGHFGRALALAPNNARLYNDIGLVLRDMGRLLEAYEAFERALTLDARWAAPLVNLGLVASQTGLLANARAFLTRALALDPTCVQAHVNLAVAMRDQGDVGVALQHYREARRFAAGTPLELEALSGLACTLNYVPGASPAEILEAHRSYGAAAARVAGPPAPRAPRPHHGRRLRVGYISGDFRNHSVAYFFEPLLAAHDRSAVEVTCYHTSADRDATTARLEGLAEHWRPVFERSDAELAALIAEDGIDVLVELSGHFAANRLRALARRLAPVQMSYLGYPNTTGLDAMDFRLTDELVDPPGEADGWHTERLLRIPGGFLCYLPADAQSQPVAPPPHERTGQVTFASFNNLAKLNDDVMGAWVEILDRVPRSRLLLKAKGLKDARVQERIAAAFAARGLSLDRLTLAPFTPGKDAHFALYGEVDLALDPFPYSGTTTTFEALWMGVPVLTLEGRTHAGRVGVSILERLGLGDTLVARSREDYVDRAVALGTAARSLSDLRGQMRPRLSSSPLMDGGRLARAVEALYRQACSAAP
jgi:predicted O-linked N-acetylglucosamine transferase (SPINDLY family)